MVLYRSIGPLTLTLGTILFFSPALANAKPYHHGYHRHYGYGYGGARWCRSDPSPPIRVTLKGPTIGAQGQLGSAWAYSLKSNA
jgi:hypothetical protein